MSVFVVSYNETDYSEVTGVFSTEQKARERVLAAGGSKRNAGFSIEEFDLDDTSEKSGLNGTSASKRTVVL